MCDWAHLVDCKKNIYLTFDDGPKLGSPFVLDVLKAQGVRATFFINAKNLNESWEASEEEILGSRKNSFLRMYQEGHMIADHSYNHMLHNAVTKANLNVYVGVKDDSQYFSKMNIDPAIALLREAGMDQHVLDQVTATMTDYIRLPWTNNWRMANISLDCYCTTPNASAENGFALADALQARGASVGHELQPAGPAAALRGCHHAD